MRLTLQNFRATSNGASVVSVAVRLAAFAAIFWIAVGAPLVHPLFHAPHGCSETVACRSSHSETSLSCPHSDRATSSRTHVDAWGGPCPVCTFFVHLGPIALLARPMGIATVQAGDAPLPATDRFYTFVDGFSRLARAPPPVLS